MTIGLLNVTMIKYASSSVEGIMSNLEISPTKNHVLFQFLMHQNVTVLRNTAGWFGVTTNTNNIKYKY